MDSIRADRDWSNLPCEILACICERLYPIDHMNFKLICNSWNSDTKNSSWFKNKIQPLAPRMPYLLMPEAGITDEEEKGDSYSLLVNLAENYTHKMPCYPQLREKWCIGSQFGWLIMLDELSNLSLLNPFTGSHIDLPPITAFEYIEAVYDSDGSLTGYVFHDEKIWGGAKRPKSYTLDFFRNNAPHKVLLTSNPSESDSYTVIAAFTLSRRLVLILRPGDKKWSFSMDLCYFSDLISHNDELIGNSRNGYTATVDLRYDPPKMTVLSTNLSFDYHWRYLVIDSLSGDLLQVCRRAGFDEEKNMCRLRGFHVFRFHPQDSSWSPVKDIGEQTMFVGNCYSTCLPAKDVPGCKLNSVYFTDDDWDMFGDYSKETVRDVGIFNLTDGKVEFFNHPDTLRIKWPPPVFITPTV